MQVFRPLQPPAVRPCSHVAGARTPREKRKLKHFRIRSKISGTPERPRLSVFRSNKHMYAQVIDDTEGRTLAAASTVAPTVKADIGEGTADKEAAAAVGKALASICLERGIDKVAFDRGGYKYHGRVMALADAAREGGLIF